MSKIRLKLIIIIITSIAAVTITNLLTTIIFTAHPFSQIFSVSALVSLSTKSSSNDNVYNIREYPVPHGSHPHDVAPVTATDAGAGIGVQHDNNTTVWYTAQALGKLGKLDKLTGKIHSIDLGHGSAPHGVIIGPDGAPWITDGGLNAIVRVDPKTESVKTFPLPKGTPFANLNTAVFDKNGTLWFTGQSGIYGKLNALTKGEERGVLKGQIKIFDAPKGPGPYGITATPNGAVYFASLAGSYIAYINPKNGSATVIEPPTPDQGARRVWSDSQGKIWVSEWNAGKLGMYNPATGKWKEWKLPGSNPMPYAIFVDDKNMVWLSDFGSNSLLNFDPKNETFKVFKIPSTGAKVRQILGTHGEIWGAESGTDKIIGLLHK